MILVTVHFFFLPPNNDNNKLPILCWGRVWCRSCLPQMPLASRRTGTAAPLTQGRPRGATPTGNTCSHWKHNGLSPDSLPRARESGLWRRRFSFIAGSCSRPLPSASEQGVRGNARTRPVLAVFRQSCCFLAAASTHSPSPCHACLSP